jgi:hypothetical protein
MRSLWIGIDPGLFGAVAAIEGNEIEIRDTPILNNGKRNVIDAAKCAAILREIKWYCSPNCVAGYDKMDPLNQATMREIHGRRLMVTIEKSQPMPPMGRPGMEKGVGHGSIASFSLGYSFGVWVGILAALEIPYQLVSPVTWKAALMKDSPKEKDASRIVADRLFPGQRENWWPLKKHHGRTDSLLLAEYGRRLSGVLEE